MTLNQTRLNDMDRVAVISSAQKLSFPIKVISAYLKLIFYPLRKVY